MQTLSQLITAVRAGDTHAFADIVARFQNMAVGYASAQLGDYHLAEDAAQEAFIHAYSSLSQLREPAAFPGWFRRIVHKHSDRIKRRQKPTVSADHLCVQDDPLAKKESEQHRRTLHSALQTLPMQERQVILLFYMGDHKRKDIAAFLDIPLSTVDNRLRTGRQKLREKVLKMAEQNIRTNAPSRDNQFVKRVRNSVESTWSWYQQAYTWSKDDALIENLQPIIDAALQNYDLEVTQTEYIKNMIVIGGNITVRVTTPHQTFALHIYNPVPMNIPNPLQSLSGIRDRKDVLNSGLQWLSALNRDTDLNVQTPIVNTSGELITQVENKDGKPINCALFTWLEGDLLTGIHKETIGRPPSDLHDMGIMLGKMHTHASQWQTPDGFILPRMDSPKLHTALEVIRWASDNDRLPKNDPNILEKCVEKIDTLMADLGENPQAWGIIHTLMPSNVVFNKGIACPIDWNSYAYGYYLYDIAWSFIWNGPNDRRQTFLDGYASIRPLPEDHIQQLEAFHIAARIIYLSHYAQNSGEDQLTGERKFVDAECAQYLTDESFLFGPGSWPQKLYW